MTARVIGVAVGLWLMFAPAVFGYGDPAAANDRIFGPVAGSLAFVAIWPVLRPIRWANLPIALWLAVAPLALGYGDSQAVVSSELSALVLAVTTPLSPSREQFGGGWSALLGGRRPGGHEAAR